MEDTEEVVTEGLTGAVLTDTGADATNFLVDCYELEFSI